MKRSSTLDCAPLETDPRETQTARELAERSNGSDEILLLWHPGTERIELSVLDLATGAGFRMGLAPEDALDAFYHPFAYAARRGCVAGPEVLPCGD